MNKKYVPYSNSRQEHMNIRANEACKVADKTKQTHFKRITYFYLATSSFIQNGSNTNGLPVIK